MKRLRVLTQPVSMKCDGDTTINIFGPPRADHFPQVSLWVLPTVRLDAHGADCRENLVEATYRWQILTTDPNNVLLELNRFTL